MKRLAQAFEALGWLILAAVFTVLRELAKLLKWLVGPV